ncbi:hypothetical protein PHLCEN_2v4562 [Hermanssonia centrifuga]|uniref:Uncharacterized protein n=1 Tax=Hermanssonia centrifuga TaxID=98765 RepID=A0A2R6PNN9_9APHY|nr:hypothetical protein PHLCEN_2v4562 [Hermanssonia centrifuga]
MPAKNPWFTGGYCWLPATSGCHLRGGGGSIRLRMCLVNGIKVWAYPSCIGVVQWHTAHTQIRLAFMGMRGTKQNSNHLRDLADCTEAADMNRADSRVQATF